MSHHLELELKNAAKRLANTRKVTVLTGAGISVASGIRPFRGKGGLWEKYDPEVVVNIANFRRSPADAWLMLREIVGVIAVADPNPAHLAITMLQKMGLVRCIITQNVDGLHQKAGSREVVEFHGSTSRVVCLECNAIYPLADVDLGVVPPPCFNCGGLLKPDAVFFGEPIPPAALLRARVESQQCDAMLVIGTSGMVEPAASLPALARSSGALIIEVNPEPSWLTTTAVDIFLQGKAEEIMPLLLAEIEKG
ncbi:MAG: NAD-dependent deacylase [Bacillota bacterium]